MARIVEERDVPSVYEEETTVRTPGTAAGTVVVDDGSGFGVGVIAGVLIAIVIAVVAVLWATGTFHRGTSNPNPGSTVTSTAPGSGGTSGNTGGSGTTGTGPAGQSNGSGSVGGSSSGGATTTP